MKKDEQNDEQKRCIICNKPYNYHYKLFGRICLSNLYIQLNISNNRFIFNKEKHLFNVIAHRNLKFFLSKNKKYALAENYIALDYLNKMDLNSTEEIKNKLNENIKRISMFKKYVKSMLPTYSLNEFYKVYNDYKDFKQLLDEFSNNKKDNKIDEATLKGFSIIFDMDKITMPLFYSVFYNLQRMFWEIVIIGGLFKGMKLSAYLMRISLTNSGEYDKEGQILTIEDENITNLLINNEEFKNDINEYLINDNIDLKEIGLRLKIGDLALALHNVTMNLKGTRKNDEMWDLEIEIYDRYDFTDIKNVNDYLESDDSLKMSLLSSTLNNFAAVSSAYNVIKPFNFVIKMHVTDYKMN